MGSELQGKYQKLAQEYAKLRSQVEVLKKAVRDEKAQKGSLEEALREKTLSLRKHVQENESLEFRNQQLSKRVALLQEELNTPSKKKKKGTEGMIKGVSDIHAQELAAKISENERLHMKILELTQKSERTVKGLESKVSKLDREIAAHNAGVEEVNREHETQLNALRTDKAMLEVKAIKQDEEIEELRRTVDRLKHSASMIKPRGAPGPLSKESKQQRVLLDNEDASFAALNVPVVDTKLQAEVLVALKSGLELVTTFTAQMSTFHSYLEQRCKAYPVDTSAGGHLSVVNQKLCGLLHSSSSFTRPIVSCLMGYCDKLEINPFSQTFHSLDALRIHGQFCDVTLQSSDKSFPAHRVVLSAASPYFYAMFTSSMLESSVGVINLDGIEPSTLESLIQFSYTARIGISSINAQSLLYAADMLQFIEVKEACGEFLMNHLCASNCLEIMILADQHQCVDLYESALLFCEACFNEIRLLDTFLTMPFQIIKFYLAREHLNIERELDVFHAAMDWLRYDTGSREQYIVELFEVIRLQLLTAQELVDDVWANTYISGSRECMHLIRNAVRHHIVPGHKMETVISDLEQFQNAHHTFITYLETLTPYLQLSLQEEISESVCGPQLTAKNQLILQTLPLFTGAFSSIDDHISILMTGSSRGIPSKNISTCLDKLNSCLKFLHQTVNELSSQFSSKIAQEYQLPTTSQKLNTTNECVVSSLSGMSATIQQLSGFLASNCEVFTTALEQTSSNLSENKQSSQSSAVQTLRVRATTYLKRLNKGCPESVPYTLAVFNVKSHSSSNENNQTLLKQVTANQEKMSKLEQEKEQLILDLQLLRIKHEKEQKKSSGLEIELVRLHHQASSPTASMTVSNIAQSTPMSPTSNLPQLKYISDSLGSISVVSGTGSEDDATDDATTIRKHFVGRITELNSQVQDSDSKAVHYYAECRALHKQLNHSMTIRNKLVQDLQSASDSIQQLQDQLVTTSSNYEKQLSTMSDHLCELNDRLVKQSDELDMLRKSSKNKRWGKQ